MSLITFEFKGSSAPPFTPTSKFEKYDRLLELLHLEGGDISLSSMEGFPSMSRPTLRDHIQTLEKMFLVVKDGHHRTSAFDLCQDCVVVLMFSLSCRRTEGHTSDNPLSFITTVSPLREALDDVQGNHGSGTHHQARALSKMNSMTPSRLPSS